VPNIFGRGDPHAHANLIFALNCHTVDHAPTNPTSVVRPVRVAMYHSGSRDALVAAYPDEDAPATLPDTINVNRQGRVLIKPVQT